MKKKLQKLASLSLAVCMLATGLAYIGTQYNDFEDMRPFIHEVNN